MELHVEGLDVRPEHALCSSLSTRFDNTSDRIFHAHIHHSSCMVFGPSPWRWISLFAHCISSAVILGVKCLIPVLIASLAPISIASPLRQVLQGSEKFHLHAVVWCSSSQ